MEGKSAESATAEESAPPSVAKLAGLFGDTLNSPRKEVPAYKPTRRKPPCSLPLPKLEVNNNGDEKLSPPQSQVPKIKVKSSPLIEKLQANLAFAPASLLPGPSPKSPGLKTMASPWSTPPSTPSSPIVQQPHSSNIEESPVSFEQPPDGAHLQGHKIRTRGSIKRRPPSRKFRKSQSDMDFDIETMNTIAKENGDKSDEGDAALRDKQDGDATSEAKNSPSEDKTSENQKSNQEDPAKQEEAGGEANAEHKECKQGEKPNKEEGKSGTSETETPATEQEPLNAEKKSEDPGEEQDKEDSNEQNKSDGDDKPEK